MTDCNHASYFMHAINKLVGLLQLVFIQLIYAIYGYISQTFRLNILYLNEKLFSPADVNNVTIINVFVPHKLDSFSCTDTQRKDVDL